MSNILITSVGRRVELVNIWEEVIKTFNRINSTVLVTDSSYKYSAACAEKKDLCLYPLLLIPII